MDETTTETLVSYGGEIKMLSDDGDTIRIGGYLVKFGSPEETDISAHRDYFTKSTDYDIEDGAKSAVYYHHGLNPTLKARKLSEATLSIKDAGVWMETELKARDDYERNIQRMVRAGKLGLSSGTAAHLVERKAVGNAHEVLKWPLGLDASLTPTPANPRGMAVALKSLVDDGELGEVPEEGAPETKNTEIPNDAPPAGLSFADHSKAVLAANEEFAERIESLIDMRCIKAGRVLSQANCERIESFVGILQPILDNMRALLKEHGPKDATEPETEDAEKKALDAEIDDLEIEFLRQQTMLNAIGV